MIRRISIAAIAGVLLPASLACATPFTDTLIKTVNGTTTGVRLDEPGSRPFPGDSYTINYTNKNGVAATANVNVSPNTGFASVAINPKSGTPVTVTNNTESITNPAKVASATDVFTPGTNTVVTNFVVNPPSILTAGGVVLGLSGSFITTQVTLDTDPASPTYGTETGTLHDVSLIATGPGTVVTLTVPDTPTITSLAAAWAQVPPGTVFPDTGIFIPQSFPLSGMLTLNGSPGTFTGGFDGMIGFLPDGSTLVDGALMFDTSFGPVSGRLSASGMPQLVPQPTALVLFALGLAVLGWTCRRSGGRAR